MTREEAICEIRNAVYSATVLFETLTNEGLLSGNGDCARQKIIEFAVTELSHRWALRAAENDAKCQRANLSI